MSKRELYDTLAAAGVKLPNYRVISQLKLEQEYAKYQQQKSAKTVEQAEPVQRVQIVQQPEDSQPEREKLPEPPVLYFEHAGWCDALHTSYYIGYYKPTSWAEYRALKPFAKPDNGGEL